MVKDSEGQNFLVSKSDPTEVNVLLLDFDLRHYRLGSNRQTKLFAPSDIDHNLCLEVLGSCRVEIDSEYLSLFTRDSTLARVNVDLFIVIYNVEDS